jgi:hypothetical protein
MTPKATPAPADAARGPPIEAAYSIAGGGFGLAESATIVPVRVLDCDGIGDRSAVVKGLRWVIAHASPATSVVNLSFSSRRHTAIDRLVAELGDRGIPAVIAAGNHARDTKAFSPTRTGCGNHLSIVVAASTADGQRWAGSNYGACVAIDAPGVAVRAFGARGEEVVTGTSYAASFVTGAIATYASACGVTTADAWRPVQAASTPSIDVDARTATTSRRLRLRAGCKRTSD